MAKSTHELRTQLVRHLDGGLAFMPLDKFVYTIPFDKLGIVPDGIPYSLWQQFSHLRFAQKDIIDFTFNEDYTEQVWPDDYWPDRPAPENDQSWQKALKDYFNDRDWLAEKITDPSVDLFAPLPHDREKNIYREVMLIVEHTAYHTGQMVVIMRLLNLHG